MLSESARAVAKVSLATDRRRRDLWLCAASALGYVATTIAAGREANEPERKAFDELNGTRAPWLVVPQQLGTPAAVGAATAVALGVRRPRLAVALGATLPVEKALEVGTKMLVRRRRPAQAPHDATLRDDAPDEGPSYPSGHAAIGFAQVALLLPYVHPAVTAATSAGALVAAVRRIHQGAHYPLDAVGGALLGVAVGSGLTWAVGRPRR